MSYVVNEDGVSFEDASLVYVRDKHGILKSTPEYENPRRVDVLREYHLVYGASCVRQLGQNLIRDQQSPCALFQICKNFVAKNLHLLESLNDFPDSIGHEIFLEALQLKKLDGKSEMLKIFCDAYKELVLSELCLKESALLINEYLQHFQCFNSLAKLDLSHCRLGNKHEYLTFIGKMESLECLYLKDNCLTDSGLATWSLPYRMLNTGPKFLKILDLSCNPDLTGFCLKSFLKFSHLKSLNLSGTGVIFTPGIERFMKILNFCLVSYIDEFSSDVSTVCTSGWAAPLIAELSSKVSRQKNDKKLKISNFGNFYSRPESLRRSNYLIKKNTNIYPVVLLQSVANVLPGTLRTLRLPKEGTETLGPGADCKPLKNRKITNIKIKEDNLEEGCDSKLLDSYL